MERDPVRFVWRSAPGLNILLLSLALLAVPSLWMILDLVRAAIDDAALGRAFEGRRTASFMRYALVLPDRVAEGPLVIFGGFTVSRAGLVQGLLAALLGAAAATGLFLACSSLVRAEIGRRALDGLERRILEGIASAPTAAAEGARRAASLASETLARQRTFLGRAIGTPALAGALLIGCLAFLAYLDLRLAGLAGIGLLGFGWATDGRAAVRARLGAAELSANAALRRSLSYLADHLSALVAHGTADLEQRRISTEMAPIRLPADALRRRSVVLLGVAVGLATGTVAAVLAAGAWLGLAGRLSPGEAAAGATAAALAVGVLERLLRWRAERAAATPVFAEIARQLGSFNARRQERSAVPLPAAGPVVAEGIAADGTLRSGRLVGLDLAFDLPAHVGLTGDPDSGARTFAGLLGGQAVPRAGRLTFGGVRLADADPADRARRLAFSGGEILLLPNTLRANILYGCRDQDAGDIEARIMSAVETAGLRGFVYRRGLAGTIDPRREPGLAAAIVAARAGIRAELERAGLTHLVQPFDPERYNPQATLGENILFGVSLGDTFREENLATQPFMRSLLDREGLTKPLADLGAAIVKSTLEMFWGLSSRSAIVGRFSLLTAAEQEEFEALLARQGGSQRSAASARDTARLIGLALRYSENRHRLGLLGPELEERLLRVRAAFARDIPKSLEPSIEFFRPDRLCAATSILDNLLFGRVAEDQAAARPQVLGVVRRVLDGLDLTRDVMRVGLQTRIDPVASGLSPTRVAAIDLARCLVRNPDNLVVERALDDLPAPDALKLLQRLTAAMSGRGLIVVLPPQLDGAAGLLDQVIPFRSGKVAPATAGRVAAPSPAGPSGERAAGLPVAEAAWSAR
ncbi:ABC transporter ATP-binding protein [Enterovirga aerilata]|uniref:ABC transporter ATP-binding protein n=1 Tax=Enterovirga aerilata TaxID=2730920 RepID=A0A849IA26_9HYPH|nr:ABC transporter ATP-binding protein [Enterovirga sp. DB1703]NNM70823.1 ABC transporter ATP-binding protein [Enterovirga sp. DB1703]